MPPQYLGPKTFLAFGPFLPFRTIHYLEYPTIRSHPSFNLQFISFWENPFFLNEINCRFSNFFESNFFWIFSKNILKIHFCIFLFRGPVELKKNHLFTGHIGQKLSKKMTGGAYLPPVGIGLILFTQCLTLSQQGNVNFPPSPCQFFYYSNFFQFYGPWKKKKMQKKIF